MTASPEARLNHCGTFFGATGCPGMVQSSAFPPTTERVSAHTADDINRRIRLQTEARIAYLADNRGDIERRLNELDREWDIERTLEANAATLALCGVVLGATVDRRFLILPAAVTTFLLQHALQGWCPPVPVFRRLGVRTAMEIHEERYALKYLRGDFGNPPPREGAAMHRARQALEAVES